MTTLIHTPIEEIPKVAIHLSSFTISVDTPHVVKDQGDATSDI